MASSKITLIGFHNWLAAENDTLFANLTLPEGIDKEVLINNILLRGGEFEVLFSDPYTMKEAIGVWSSKWSWTFSKWIKAINLEYNPLENYDRMETWDESEKGSNKGTTENTNEGKTTDSSSSSGEMENSVSAFDSISFSPHDKSVSSNKTDATTNIQASNNGSSENEYSNTATRTGRAHGNIGVTTSQQMLQSELDIAMFNLYDQITDIFLREFVIPVY